MPFDTVGILTPIDFPLEQPTVISAVDREIFVNEAPLFGRLPHKQATSEVYTITSYNVRPRNYVLGTGDITNVATTLPIADASVFLVGDVLELNDGTNSEYVEVVSAPNLVPTPNTLTVRRGRGGTAGTAFATATPTNIRLIGQSRTGGEIDQQAHRPIVTTVQQIVQTSMFPVQVGGKAEAISNVVLPANSGGSQMGYERAVMAVEFVRDVEYSMYYGKGEAPAASGDRAKMKGLKALITAYNGGSNVKPNAGASYTRATFIADTITKIYAAGGMADTILCSTDFLGFLDTWVPNKTSFMGAARQTSLGFEIDEIVLPLQANPLTFVPSLQLRPGTAVVLSSNDLDVRSLREMFWQPRGVRGDAMMGDWIGDYTINMNRPQWHAWVEGISSVA